MKKYRAWDKEEMNFIYFTTTEGINFHCDLTYQKLNIKVHEAFTGLHDKNGKEIYEGDIVQIKMSSGVFHTEAVLFFQGSFCIEVTDIENYLILGKTIINREVEIIGNIHEVNNEL